MPPPTPSPRRGLRLAVIVVATLLTAITAVVIAAVLTVRSQLLDSVDERAQDRDRAERVVQERARRYAATVVRAEPDVSDQRLDELAIDLNVTVRVIDRGPGQPGDLRLVIQVIEPYRGGLTTGASVLACYRIDLTRRGTLNATHRLTELPNCPPISRTPAVEDTTG